MRRSLSFAAAAFVVAAPLAAASAVHGCSSGEQFESVCLWIADPDNCYRKFRADSVDNGETCKPLGDPSPVNLADATNTNGTPNGSFLSRTALDVCFIAGGGQVVFDPPIDLESFPPSPVAEPITYKMTFMRANGSECGAASYTSPHGFSFTINPPPDAGAAAADAGTTTTDAGSDAGTPVPYGTYTQVIQPGRDAFDSTCPSGESHHFNLFDVNGLSATADGGAQTQCPLFTDLVPRASFVVNPGGINAPGAVSFTVYWPPLDVTYPSEALLQGGPAVQAVPITYFNCSIAPKPDTCLNGEKDPNETDIDCGGTELKPGCPQRCGDGQGCVNDCDCLESMFCGVVAGVKVCVAPEGGGVPPRDCSSFILCEDKMKDGAETDVDCGGGDCPQCADGKVCLASTDCVSGYCFEGLCRSPMCTDGIQNLGETDKDCGGDTMCPRCANGLKCTANSDCVSGNCIGGTCQPVDCNDGVKNGSETDIDCGGGCVAELKACDNLKACLVNGDCKNNACVNGVCLFPSCTDGVKDGAESDKDCGGNCDPCADNLGCTKDTECQSGLCGFSTATTQKCFPSSCLVDGGPNLCGGGACPLCADGSPCAKNSDCLNFGCVNKVCQTPTCADGAQDGAETDIDCGGGTCPKCDPGKKCNQDSDCGGTLMKCINNVCQ